MCKGGARTFVLKVLEQRAPETRGIVYRCIKVALLQRSIYEHAGHNRILAVRGPFVVIVQMAILQVEWWLLGIVLEKRVDSATLVKVRRELLDKATESLTNDLV